MKAKIKAKFVKAAFFFFFFPLFSEIKIQNNYSLTDIWKSALFCYDLDVDVKKDNLGFNAGGKINFLNGFDIEDLTDFTFNFDSFVNADCFLSVFYENENFKISPFFELSNLHSQSGQIYYFPGTIEIPFVDTFGIKLRLFNNFLDIFFSSGKGYFDFQNETSSSEIPDFLDFSQYFVSAVYKNQLSFSDFSFDTVLSYSYFCGGFKGEIKDFSSCTSLIFKKNFEEIKISGIDSIHLISAGEKVTYTYKNLEFPLEIRDFFVCDENLRGNYSWNTNDSDKSFLFLMSLAGYSSQGSKTFEYDSLSLYNLLFMDSGCNVNCAFNNKNPMNLIFHFGKKFYIPFKINLENNNSHNEIDSELIKKCLLSGFNFSVTINFQR